MKVSVWKCKCEFCSKDFTGTTKKSTEQARSDHEKDCEGIKKLHELYQIPLEDRLVLFKILEEDEQVKTVKNFIKKHGLSVERMRNILDEIGEEDEGRLYKNSNRNRDTA